MRQIILVAHNLRSCYNVGSLLRTADGIGVECVILSGYTPYPLAPGDNRLPHVAQKIHRQIAKTALGSEESVAWESVNNLLPRLAQLRRAGYTICALEQTPTSLSLPGFDPPDRMVLIVGREVEGMEPELLELCDMRLEIPMYGAKESYNVAQAAAMALYHCRFKPQ